MMLHCQQLNSDEINKKHEEHSKSHHPLYKPSTICIDNQQLIIICVHNNKAQMLTFNFKKLLVQIKERNSKNAFILVI